jgi:hypothetical protein
LVRVIPEVVAKVEEKLAAEDVEDEVDEARLVTFGDGLLLEWMFIWFRTCVDICKNVTEK